MNNSSNWPIGAELIYSAEQVSHAWDDIAARLQPILQARAESRNLVALAVMNGGLFPLAQLTVRLKLPLQVDYVHATRYRDEQRGGEIEWRSGPTRDLSNSIVLLIDDIFDEGYTLQAVKQRLQQQYDCEIITLVLTRKQHQRGLARDWVDFHALDVPDRFVFGCGMDIAGHWRHLDAIWALPEEHK